MARIRSFEEGTQSIKIHRTEVDCYHQTIRDSSGNLHIHLTTFGSDDRESAPKSSQSIQLNEAAARQLVQILQEAFHF
ncbi:hypothetical protein [Kribbella pratensis]|uniref:Methionyl-tRNA formyltransferase n=1 Tax=Kribbella pratensis TaxID=2512112 RepID=A0A4R8CPG3_9ACTN|nr:hypothetical protein [Kribbella pratensis]TDW78049.1 hypothetical protein EV653_3238 [Kribbella pratensis]